jgi:multiple sugar transport system permease protein
MAEISIDSRKIKKIERTGKKVFKIFRAYLIFCLSFVVLYPLLYMISIAFRTGLDVIDPVVIWIPKNFTLRNFTEIMEIIGYWKSLMSTASVSLVATALQLVVCSITGYGLASFRFRGNGLLFAGVLLTIMVPIQVIAIPMFLQIRYFDFFGIGRFLALFSGQNLHVNLYNSALAIFLPAALGNGIRGGLYIFVFRQFFKGLPMDLEDAAYIDGCSVFKTYVRIIFPLSMPPALVVFLLSFLWYWNDVFVTPFFFSNAKTLALAVDTIPSRLALGYDFYQVFTYQQAACLLMILPVLLVFLVLQKYFIQSVDKTGLK